MAELKSNLSAIAAKCPGAASAALLQTAADIVMLVKQLAPVDTGALRQSYGAVPLSSNAVRIGSDKNYAVFQEFGTSKMAAQPHFTPAFMQSEPTFKKRITQAMKKIVG